MPDPATECGSNPIVRCKLLYSDGSPFSPYCSFMVISEKEQR